MDPIWHKAGFWIAIGFAVIVKLKSSQALSPWAILATIFMAFGAAYLFTDFALELLGEDSPSDNFRHAAAALIALTSEQISRFILGITPEDVKAFIRGKSK